MRCLVLEKKIDEGNVKKGLSETLGIDYDDDGGDTVSRSEMTLDNADPAMLQMFSNWKSSGITNRDGSWDDFMKLINAGEEEDPEIT